MDGTLYDNRFHQVSTKTFEALHTLQEQGNYVFLATSRCLKELENLPRAMYNFTFDGRITDGGALILNKEKQVIKHQPISTEIVQAINTYCKENHIYFRYSTLDGNYFSSPDNQAFHELEFQLYLNAPIYKPYEDDACLNLLIWTQTPQQRDELKEICRDCSIVSYPECLEIRDSHIDKASAIQEMIERFQLQRTICFGDGENDVQMLKLADQGIAMQNACQELKEIADQIIGPVDQDGIYYYLKEQEVR